MTRPLTPNPQTAEGRLVQRIFKLPNLRAQDRALIERAAAEHHSAISLQRKPTLANLTGEQLNAALLEILKSHVLRSGRSHRELERKLRLAHGTIGNMFRGQTELRLKRVEAIGRIFGLTLEQLLLQALGYTVPPAEGDLNRDEHLAQLVADKVVDALRTPGDRSCIELSVTSLTRSLVEDR